MCRQGFSKMDINSTGKNCQELANGIILNQDASVKQGIESPGWTQPREWEEILANYTSDTLSNKQNTQKFKKT